MRLGIDFHHAYAWSRTRKGGWAIAQSPILNTTITLERLAKRGYESMLDYYFKVPLNKRSWAPPLHLEPLPNAFGKVRTYGGVRASPR